MKPIQLTMQAFGPFANKEVIDFRQLGTNPLFLINGPTGSGKTSILDAICFALYGETTGNERQAIQMRCDQASDQLATEVSLEFELNGKTYRVTRAPEQQALKARGEGMTTRKHSASLYQISGEEALITSKTAQVKSEITQLLGLNETQFRQVMVLPQGKFRELLLASSKDREAIFGQLFQTDVYKKIEFALKEKASAISKAKDEFDNQILGALQVAEVTTEQELEQQAKVLQLELAKAQQAETAQSNTLNIAKTALQQANVLHQQFNQLSETQTRLQAHRTREAQIKQLEFQLQLANSAVKLDAAFSNKQALNQQVIGFEAELNRLTKRMIQVAQDHQKNQQARQLAQDNSSAITKLNERLSYLDQLKIQLADKANLTQQMSDLTASQAVNDKNLVQYLELKTQLEQQAQQGVEKLEQARKDLAEKPLLEAALAQQLRQCNDVSKLQAQKSHLKELQAVFLTQQKTVEQAQTLMTSEQKNADQLELRWHNSQAAQLAQKLSVDMPCPVCGSQEHPAPAVFDGESVTKNAVQAARKQERAAVDEFNRQSSALKQQQAVLELESKNITLLEAELDEVVNLDLEQLKQALTKKEQQIKRLAAIDVAKIEQEVATLNQRCVVGEEKINQLKASMVANDSQLGILQQQVEKLSANIAPQYGSLEAVEQQYRQEQHKIEQLNQALEVAQKAENQSQIELVSLESKITTNQQLLEQNRQQSAAAIAEWETQLQASVLYSEQHYLECRAEATQIELWQGQIKQYQQTEIQLQQTIVDLKQQLKQETPPDVEQCQLALNQAELAYKQVRSELDKVHSIAKRIEKVQQDIAHLHCKNTQLAEQYKVYGTLYEVASGKTGSRVSLHRFVLGVLLDDVLIQASQRLTMMSKGRYQLLRKTEGFKGAAGRGLDLCVIDGYSGKTRDVATLSGGESFMAALSLALGLSDVVQSYSGGIKLNTLFIDEGFGSLDPESLDLAIQTLIDLQQAGRMVGLISHVSELKQQMPVRIEIQPSRVGSQIKLVTL